MSACLRDGLILLCAAAAIVGAAAPEDARWLH
ncbi:MAG: hypothetical protein GAK43_00253 [Stenotrophomonas maltophilia]|nr:MAG: hypothetical protein GAK43_00253 [Stenotrophomonas maltophilia]